MIEPETWFTLYSLAQLGAIHERVTLTTRQLGNFMGVSQQTASRRVAHCAESGYISRTLTANGMGVELTEQGRNELLQILGGLETALAQTGNEILIRGKVVDGLGEGAYYVDAYSSRFRSALGFAPFSGTLNVKVADEESQRAVSRMKHTPPLVVTGFTREGRTFGDVICYRVRVNDKIEGAVVIAQRTHHSQDILEVIAPVNLRKKLGLGVDEALVLRVVPLHLVT
ncbi:MAG: riboflavin kinase [Candidatus Thorarchaeota archaeon]|nr:MAG: riboflavin kinase [Candidatus Thorarchaeota archaeon]